MSDDDLIRRGDAREILEDGGFLERSLDRLAALPAVTVGVKPLVWEAGEREFLISGITDEEWAAFMGVEE